MEAPATCTARIDTKPQKGAVRERGMNRKGHRSGEKGCPELKLVKEIKKVRGVGS